MKPVIYSFVLGSLQNNTYLLVDPVSGEAALVDPAEGAERIAQDALKKQLHITQVWITHAHFDHLAGLPALSHILENTFKVGLHPNDLPLWHAGAGAAWFGIDFNPGLEPTILFQDQQILPVGGTHWKVIHTPGHSQGHVSFYNSDINAVLCGDVIFRESIGRTDLPGGNQSELLKTIRDKILNLPLHTHLLSGHGEESTVEHELTYNPYL